MSEISGFDISIYMISNDFVHYKIVFLRVWVLPTNFMLVVVLLSINNLNIFLSNQSWGTLEVFYQAVFIPKIVSHKVMKYEFNLKSEQASF